MSDLMHLQNGSDVRGVAMEMEGAAPVNLSGEAANRIAHGFALWLAKRTGKSAAELVVGVGHDSRLTAQALKTEIAKGLAAEGVKVADCGLASTPAMFMGTVFGETDFDGSIMITASHLPKNRNGMKFFTKDGGLDKPDITAVLQLAGGVEAASGEALLQPAKLMQLYADSLRKKIVEGVNAGGKPLEGLHIVVDAGNGAGGFFVADVLRPLGADCTGSQFLQPDGNFPNHAPNPEDKAAMRAIQKAVLESKADLGVIFDTDVDRMSAVFPDGTEVNRDAIIAMMAAVLAPENPGSAVVTDSVTSDRLTVFLQDKLGLVHRRFKRGYKNVINEAVRLNAEGVDTPLAIETSGHGALRENYFLDDGAYMAVKIVIAAARAKREGQVLASLLEGLPPAGTEREVRMNISTEDFAAYGREVLAAFEQRAKQAGYELAPTSEGVRLRFEGKGWLLLRMSLHDPLMPLNVEGETPQDCEELLQIVGQLLQGFDKLDMSVLKM